MTKHPNSREVTIFRTKTFLESAQGAEAADYMADAKKSVGSYFAGGGSSRIGSGLEFWEEELLLPRMLSVPVHHPDFRKKVDEYYINISTAIPALHGRSFEIGLKSDNNKVLSEDNTPLNLEDYLRYRHAVKNPDVAMTREEGNSMSHIKKYYVFNPYELKEKEHNENESRDAALGLFLAVKEDAKKNKSKLDILLTLLGRDPREFSGKNADKDKENVLRELSMSEPVKFCETYESGDLDERYWLRTLVNLGILRMIQGKYVDVETRQARANNEAEMLFWFKDQDNSDLVSMYKARAQEKLLEPLPKNVKRTQALPGKTLAATNRK